MSEELPILSRSVSHVGVHYKTRRKKIHSQSVHAGVLLKVLFESLCFKWYEGPGFSSSVRDGMSRCTPLWVQTVLRLPRPCSPSSSSGPVPEITSKSPFPSVSSHLSSPDRSNFVKVSEIQYPHQTPTDHGLGPYWFRLLITEDPIWTVYLLLPRLNHQTYSFSSRTDLKRKRFLTDRGPHR